MEVKFVRPFAARSRMTEQSTVLYGLLALFAIVYLWRWLYPAQSQVRTSFTHDSDTLLKGGVVRQLRHIPTIGPSAPILSYWGAVRYSIDGMSVAMEGYRKVKRLTHCAPL